MRLASLLRLLHEKVTRVRFPARPLTEEYMIELTDLDEIKAKMPVTYILHVYGYAPEARHGRDIMYLTPWRQDSNPSLACYPTDDGGVVDRWRDMARSEGGDILDLIGKLLERESTFADRLDHARRLYAQFVVSDWTPPEPVAGRGSFDLEAARAEMADWELNNDLGALAGWLRSREDSLQSVPAEWLHETMRVTAINGEIKAPYLSKAGELVAYKYRKPGAGEKFKSAAGTSGMWTVFYGEWLDTDPSLPVVLCEGEPDVWSGTHATKDYTFLGLPTGAGTRPEKMASRLAGRRVLIALDGDEAGRDASIIWAEELSGQSAVEIVPVPPGKDLSSVADVPDLLRRARRYEAPLPGLLVLDGRYHRASKDGSSGMQLSDFEVVPLRVMQSDLGGYSYESRVAGREELLLQSDLATKVTFKRWSHDRGLTWNGSDADVGLLASRLKSESIFCPSETASDVAGLHEKHVVWDGGSIGDRPVRYVPSASKVSLDIRVREGRGDHRTILAMREMNHHRITDPILAWAAVAPFRSLLPQFPVLNVAGTSGSGKTTTVQAIIPALTGSHIFQTLSSSTPYAVESIINSTNGFPVVFDEYRPGARDASLLRLEQLARDAYDGTSSAKSAGGDKWNEIAYIRTMAPIVIAGEQSITETSHAERMILVQVVRPTVRDPQHQRALDFVKATDDGSLAWSFLSHVVRSVQDSDRLSVTPQGAPELPDRVRYNLGVLDLGWRILNDFLGERGASPLSAPDWSGIIETTASVTATNPTVEALGWAKGDRNGSENVWIEDGELVVAAAGFVADVKRAGVFVLPGNNARTITDQLQADYGAVLTKRTPPMGGIRKNVWVMPLADIMPDEVD